MAGTCTIPGCPRPIYASGICGSHLWRLRIHGDTFPHIPIGALRSATESRRLRGPTLCICPVSRPEGKCCIVCRMPSIHRMSAVLRAVALEQIPQLRTQTVELVT